MSYRTNDTCVCCGGYALNEYLDLGTQPLANSYHKGEVLPAYPLVLANCPNCGHNQLTVSVDPPEMFDHYLYVSDTSKSLDDYFEWLAGHVLDRQGPTDDAGPKVLEIACNSGLLLEKFHRRGLRCVGVDPAKNLRPLAKARGLLTLTEYWNTETALKLTGKWGGSVSEANPGFESWDVDGHQFNTILAVHVLPHVPDPVEFLAACKLALAPGGKVWVQTSQCDMFKNNEFDAVYHEHTSYFTARSFRHLAERVGLKVTGAKRVPIHSMSFLFELSEADGHCEDFRRMLHEEVELGMDRSKFYKEFAAQAVEAAQALAAAIDEFRLAGKKVVGYGAAAKGNTVLNFINRKLDYIVDDNELKWGYLTPGKDIPIVPPAMLSQEAEDVVVVPLAWNFFDEITRRAAKCLRHPATFVKYFPELKLELVQPSEQTLSGIEIREGTDD